MPSVFLISLTFVKNSIPMVTMAQWLGQQGSEAVGWDLSLCRAKYFYDFTDICQSFQLFPWLFSRIFYDFTIICQKLQ